MSCEKWEPLRRCEKRVEMRSGGKGVGRGGKGWEEMKRSEKRWDRLKRVEKSGEEVRRIEKRWEGWEDVTGVEKSWEGVTAVEKRWGRIHKRVPNLWCSSSTPIGKCVLHSHSIAFLFAGDFRRASRGLYFYICKVTVIIISSNINNSTNRNNNDINSYVIVFLSVLQIYLNCICMTMYLGWSNLWASISW